MYSKPKTLPQDLLELRKLLVESYQRGEPLSISAFAIAPDATYSRPGHRRVLPYRRPEGPFAIFEQDEYMAQEETASPGDHDAEPAWIDVRIEFVTPYAYPQYTVTCLERVT